MYRNAWRAALLVGALMAVLPANAAVVRYRPGVYWGRGFGWYDPFFYGPYPMYTNRSAGQVKIDPKVFGNDAQVFINGAYAGTAKERKSTWLRAGVYQVEVRQQDRKVYDKKVFVVSGKTIQVRPDLPPVNKP